MKSLVTGPNTRAILMASAAPGLIASVGFANTLSALIPDIYAAMDVVSRELVGFIPTVGRAFGVEGAAVGQAVKIPISTVQTAVDNTPSMTVPEPPDNVMTTSSMAITKSRAVPFGFTGEEQKGLNSGSGPGYLSARGMIIAEALRTLTNEVETDLSVEGAAAASRAYGTAGTAPFGSGDLTDLAQVQKILDDNGAPPSRAAILNTAAAAKLITIGNLSKVNEAGTQMTLRDGELLDIYGLSVHKTGQSVSHTKGTAASATTSNAGFAVGATTIALASAGTGTITAGDVVTFAGDTNKYLVVTGDADVSNGGSIVIAAPGLRVAIPASTTAITVGNSYTAGGVAFSSDALWLAARPPAIPEEGDLAVDRMMITDPRSGLTFEISIYLGFQKVEYRISLAWGVKATKPRHIALLLG